MVAAFRCAEAFMRSATVALGEVLVLRVERQAPDKFTGAAGRPTDLGGEGVVVRDQRGVGRTESDEASHR